MEGIRDICSFAEAQVREQGEPSRASSNFASSPASTNVCAMHNAAGSLLCPILYAEVAVVDSYMLVLGSKQGGKSSLVTAFASPQKGVLRARPPCLSNVVPACCWQTWAPEHYFCCDASARGPRYNVRYAPETTLAFRLPPARLHACELPLLFPPLQSRMLSSRRWDSSTLLLGAQLLCRLAARMLASLFRALDCRPRTARRRRRRAIARCAMCGSSAGTTPPSPS